MGKDAKGDRVLPERKSHGGFRKKKVQDQDAAAKPKAAGRNDLLHTLDEFAKLFMEVCASDSANLCGKARGRWEEWTVHNAIISHSYAWRYLRVTVR